VSATKRVGHSESPGSSFSPELPGVAAVEVEIGPERPDEEPHNLPPRTPGGYDDFTPITRGEWNCLMDTPLSLPSLGRVEIC
jgi:hypothetical protein